MKECKLDCALQHEGCCTWDLIECKAHSNDDLISAVPKTFFDEGVE